MTAHLAPAASGEAPSPSIGSNLPQTRFHVELDKAGQVHVRCCQGKETLASIGLSVAGFKSLCTQGLLKKPHALQVGALHDWVELDGVLYSFEKGRNDAAKLERVLNEHYIPSTPVGQGMDVVVLSNAASSTGFDIQFPARVGGVIDNRRRPLNEETLELLQDPVKCGLLQKGIIIKLTRPTLIFKQKTVEGGERYLESGPESLVCVSDDDGKQTTVDLSRPVNYLRLSTIEMTAVFNHPAIHKHSRMTKVATPLPQKPAEAVVPASPERAPLSSSPTPARLDTCQSKPTAANPPLSSNTTPPVPNHARKDRPQSEAGVKPPEPAQLPLPAAAAPSEPPKPGPNLWMRPALAEPPIRHDWFACLVYTEMARLFGNSFETRLGLSNCWASAMGETRDPSHPEFKGVFLTEKGGLGYLNCGHIVRFNKGVAFLGTQENALEGIGITLLAIGLDSDERVVFIVNDNFRSKFGVPAQKVAEELARLQQFGSLIMSVDEVLAIDDPIEVLWTAPAQQSDPANPQAIEHHRPRE